MPPLEQLQLDLDCCSRPALPGRTLAKDRGGRAPRLQHDLNLQFRACELLRRHGAIRIARELRVQWNARLKSCAGRADYRHKLISLNPRLREHGATEIEQTLRHELAHLLAQARAGRRRIAPHGVEWRMACRDLGIDGEARCHTLPFPVTRRARRFLYKCPNCRSSFSRVRRIRRTVACLACCRAYNRGNFDARFRLRLVELKGVHKLIP
jgi:SprT protein